MAKASIKSLNNNIKKHLEEMVEKASHLRGFMERVVYPSYLKAQMKRWMTEGRSDGYGDLPPWQPLSARYKAWKLKRWAAAPGGGQKMMIASGKLFQAAMNQGPGHRKIVTDRSLIVGIDPGVVPYAKYVNAERPFFIFSDEMMDGLKDKYKKFVIERQR